MYRIVFFVLLCFSINAQVGIGEWRLHVPVHKGKQVAETPSQVFMSTSYSMLAYDKESFELKEWSKVNGLSDNGVNAIKYDEDRSQLVIAYKSGNLDLFSESQVINISDIKRYPIAGDKIINHIYIYKDKAYLACGFGIVVLDLIRKEIKETYYIGENASFINILETTVHNDTLFAATETGLYQAGMSSNNLADFNNWTVNAQFENKHVSALASFQGQLLVNHFIEGFANDSLWILKNSDWSLFPINEADDFYQLDASDDELMIAGNYKAYVFAEDLTLQSSIYTYGEESPQPNMIIKGSNDSEYWIADRKYGLVHSKDPWNNEVLSPNSVEYEFAYAFDAKGDALWSAGGGKESSGGNIWNTNSCQSFLSNSWSSFVFNEQDAVEVELYDMVDVAINPSNTNQVYFAGWGGGLVETNNGNVVNVYNETNSTLESSIVDGFYFLRIGAIAIDAEQRVWIGNSIADDVLKMKDGEEWYSFNLGNAASITSEVRNIMVSDRYNQVWIALEDGNIVVYDHKGTIDDDSDDEVKKITTSAGAGAIPNKHVNVVKEDKDGEIWVGTDEGLSVFYSPSLIFESGSEWDSQQIIIQQGEYFQNLLEASVITDMVIDGANQKWFATESDGVYLFSENGQEEIHHFTTENSPLLSNTIQSIVVQEKTGEVFIGTEEGVISYRGVATEGGNVFGEAYAFPNPVRPGYTGNIGITGLVTNAIVKITDISGDLVSETRAEGGQAVWDGKRIDGSEVSSGVYLVFCSDENGEQTLATKILVVK